MAALDRVRVHKALRTADELDSVTGAPRVPLAGTLVVCDFNETAMPFQNAVAPARPTATSQDYFGSATATVFSPDSPTGGAGDRSMEFSTGGRRVIVPDPDTAVMLGNGHFTIQAWVEFGAQSGRAALFSNSGPGAPFHSPLTIERCLSPRLVSWVSLQLLRYQATMAGIISPWYTRPARSLDFAWTASLDRRCRTPGEC